MLQRIKFLGVVALFWVLFFMVFRFIFLVYQWNIANAYSFVELAKAFLSGSRHDLSLMGYVVMLSGLIISVTFFLSGRKLKTLFTVLFSAIVILFLLLLVPNLELYRNWGFHIDASVLDYLKTPKEAMASTVASIYLLQAFIFVASLVVAIWSLRKFVIPKLNRVEPVKFTRVPILLFITATMIIPIRGGFGIAPMNVGFVYFSNHAFVNHLAVNPVWNFAYSMKKMKKNRVTFHYMDNQKMNAVMDSLKAPYSQERLQVTNAEKPNVLILIMESFTSKATGLIPQGAKVTPNLDSLAKNGVYFSNFYGIGDRSKIGIVGILSGYPSLPRRSVIAYTDKVEKLPSICKKFKEKGYSSAFYYGGDIRFANMNSYIKVMGFDKIVTENDFPSELNNTKWGVHDEYVFDYLLKDIKAAKKPFFKTYFTLSSHEPFNVPIKQIKGNSEDQRFLNSVYYTDKCLGNFMTALKKTDKWDNTIVIIVADHGTRYLMKSQPTDIIKYQIPMIWTGGAITAKGVTVDKFGCQPDIANTLLNQLGWGSESFIMGKDLLQNNQRGYAYFDYNNGFGYIDANERSVYDLTAKKYVHRQGDNFNGEQWKAILQFINQDFNKR